MRLKDHPEKDGKRVWLDQAELTQFITHPDDPRHRVAFMLGGRCGLRRSEITQVQKKDFVDGPTGTHLRVWEEYAKRNKYREPPCPSDLATTVQTMTYDSAPGTPVVDVDTNTIYRWVKTTAAELQTETGDEGWQFFTPHDLRRTWGVDLLEQGVLPSVVMNWGGWDDWETFREHYLGEFSPGAIKQQRALVSYLEGDSETPSGAVSAARYPGGSRFQNTRAEQ